VLTPATMGSMTRDTPAVANAPLPAGVVGPEPPVEDRRTRGAEEELAEVTNVAGALLAEEAAVGVAVMVAVDPVLDTAVVAVAVPALEPAVEATTDEEDGDRVEAAAEDAGAEALLEDRAPVPAVPAVPAVPTVPAELADAVEDDKAADDEAAAGEDD